MKNVNRICIYGSIILLICLAACKKTSEPNYVEYKKYFSLRVGKVITYKLDSTITAPFGVSFLKNSYTIKDSVVALIKDNSNRDTYRIFRFQLDPATGEWNSTNTFFITPLANSIEYVENNHRYISLVNPITEGKTWMGNSYITQYIYHPNDGILSWDFTYIEVEQPKKIGNFNFANTVTVQQYDSSENKVFVPNFYNSYTKSYEVYADTVGLVYKDVFSWQYQASTVITCRFEKPKTGGGLDTITVNCGSVRCDSLRNLPNYRVISCDTLLNNFNYEGYGVKQMILSHN